MFRVMLEGAGARLRDVESGAIERLGFYATRWVRAASPEEAERAAREIVIEELAAVGVGAGRDAPLKIEVCETARVSWLEGFARRGTRRGFSFFPETPE